MDVLHGAQEDVFERVAAEVQAAQLDVLFGGNAVDVANFKSFGEHHTEPSASTGGALAAKGCDRIGERCFIAASFHFYKTSI
jgi:hypothetical protein